MESSLKKKRMRTIAIIAVVAIVIIAALLRLNIEPADYKVSLGKQITKAEQMVADASNNTGNAKGQYAEYEVKAFQNQIAAAQAVVDDESSVYETEKEIYNTLKAEIKDFKDSKNAEVMTAKEQEALISEEGADTKAIELSVYRSLDWNIAGADITEAADLNLYAREDGPYYSRLIAYMEQFAMEGQTLAFYHMGDMPGTFQVSSTFYNTTSNAKTGYVYKLNEKDNTLNFVTKAKIAEEQATFDINEGGSYMILSKKITEYATKAELAAVAKQITDGETDLDVASAKKIQENKEKVKNVKDAKETEGEASDVVVAEEPEKQENTDVAATDGTEENTDVSQPAATTDPTVTDPNAGTGATDQQTSTDTDKKDNKPSTNKTDSNSGSTGSSNSGGSSSTGNSGSTGSGSNSGTSTTPSGGSSSGTTVTPTVPADDGKITVTVEIRCDTLAADTSKLADQSLVVYVPSNGTILAATEYKCEEGTSVYDILNNVCRNNNIHLEAEYDPIYNGYYVKGINHLYEFNGGTYSGWLYKVNEVIPSVGASQYAVQDGDAIVWAYTCTNGDVSGTRQ